MEKAGTVTFHFEVLHNKVGADFYLCLLLWAYTTFISIQNIPKIIVKFNIQTSIGKKSRLLTFPLITSDIPFLHVRVT